MKNKLLALTIISTLLLSSLANANKVLNIFITNNTPYTIHLIKSNYNKTSLNFDTDSIAPYAKKIEIATGDNSNGGGYDYDVTFLAQLGENKNMHNTPLMHLYGYGINSPIIDNGQRITPNPIQIEDQYFYVRSLMSIDNGVLGYVFQIDRMDHK